MKTILKIEELLMFILGIYAFDQLDFSWWWFLVLILTPDIGILGYVVNDKIGAIIYNVLHHKGIAIIVYLSAIYFQNEIVQLVGIILFSHSSLDRALGYGLKYSEGFKHTHLGIIGQSR